MLQFLLLTCLIHDVDIQDVVEGDNKKIAIKSKKGDTLMNFKAKSLDQKQEWVKEFQSKAVSQVIEDLSEDEFQLIEETVTEPEVKKTKLASESEVKATEEEKIQQSETDAKVEVLEDFEAYEEMNTAITESLRSGSLTSLEDFQSALEDEASLCVTASETDGMSAKPLFTKALHGITCKLGETATFECQVATSSPTSVMWLKDNMPITTSDHFVMTSDDIRHCLTIKNANIEDGGLYTVVVTNAHGTNSSSATLSVISETDVQRPKSPGGSTLPYAPRFKEKLMDSRLIENTNARFTITVDGVPEPTVTFYKNETELKQDNRIKIISTIKGVYELIMDSVTLSDAGKYSCVAVNSEGQDVTMGNIAVTKEKVSLHVTQDDDGISISTGRDSKEPQYTWFKDGSEFEASERFKVAYSDGEDTLALVFQHVTPEDAGLYTCVASTSGGKISCSAELTVQGAELPRDHEAPVLTGKLEDVEVSEGASAMLELKATGYPRPKITWFKGKEELTAGERYKHLFEGSDTYTLVIKKVQKNDSGQYSATLKNDMGEINCSCQLTVKSSPVFRKQMKDMAVMTDKPVKFEVEVEGNPTPEIKWMKDDQELKIDNKHLKVTEEESNSYILTIDHIVKDDAGKYSCKITNEHGSDQTDANLAVAGKPSFTQKLSDIEASENEEVDFKVKVSGEPQPKIKWFIDDMEITETKNYKFIENKDTGEYMLKIKDVNSSLSGKYTCEASNSVGKESTSGTLSVKDYMQFVILAICYYLEGKNKILASFKCNNAKKLRKSMHEELDQVLLKWFSQQRLKNTTISGAILQSKEELFRKQIESAEPPSFVQGLKDVTAVNGEDAKFTVKLKGKPKPTIKWTKDDAELTIDNKKVKVIEEASETYTLVLKEVNSKDSGTYSCEISNKSGKDISSGKLSVKSPAKFIQGLKDSDVEENVSASFTVKISGEPKPDIKWTKDGTTLTIDGTHIKQIEEESATFTLVIDKVSKQDVGEYSCEITNEHGKDITKCRLGVKVLAPAKFIQGLKDSDVEENVSASFTVKISGEPKPDIKWTKDGTTLTIDGTHIKQIEEESATFTLVIDKVSKQDVGEYSCEITNEHGKDITKCRLGVKAKPTFKKKLVDKESVEGDVNVEFTVEVDGSPSPKVQWFLGNVEITSNEKYTVSNDEASYTLTLKKVASDMSGTYKCKATNPHGSSETSAEFTVYVKPKIIDGLKDLEVKEGEKVEMTVKIAASPSPDIKWKKNGEDISAEATIKIKQDVPNCTTAIFEKVTVVMTGEYECYIKNKVGEASTKGKLIVQSTEDTQPPTIIQKLTDQEILVGDAVRMEVKLIGKPTPEVKWYLNDKEVSSGGRIRIDSVLSDNYYSLTIKDVTLEDEGNYVCKAVNEKGEASTSATLTVEGISEFFSIYNKLSITIKSQNEIKILLTSQIAEQGTPFLNSVVHKYNGYSYELEFITTVPPNSVKGDVKIQSKYQELKDDKSLHESNNIVISGDDGHFSVIIRSIKEENIGTYKCIASNSAGKAESKGVLSIKNEPPKFLKEIGDREAKKGDNIIFEVRLSGYPLPEVTWLKNNVPVVSKIHGLSVDDIAVFTCKAKNTAGEVSCKGALHLIEVPPSVQKTLPGTLTVKEGEPFKLEAKFDSEPKPDIKCTKLICKHMYKKNGHISLTINDVTTDDAGEYKVIATNEIGDVSSTAKLTVIENGHISLTINDVTTDDAGEYKVIATNEIGDVSSTAKLTVIAVSPPKEKKPAEAVEPKQSEPEKVPEPSKATEVESAKVPETPKVAEVEAPKEPEPSVKAPTIKGKVPEFSSYLKPAQFYEGESGQLIAKVTGEPMPKIKWLKNGKPILPSDHIKLSESPDGTVTLTFDKVTPDDAGKYTLVISNEAGEEKSEAPVAVIPATKKTDKAPKFKIVEGLQPLMVPEGEPGRFQIKVSGEGKPIIIWKKDGKDIISSDHIKLVEEPGGVFALTIDKAVPSDVGKYAVVIIFDNGEEKSEALMTVVPKMEIPSIGKKPEFLQSLQPKQIALTQPVVLQAKVIGEPKPSIKWLKDGEEIRPTSNITMTEEPDGTIALKIDSVDYSDAGKYVAVATNIEGKTRNAAAVDVLVPAKKKPEFLTDLQPVTCNDGDSVTLKAKISGEPKPKIKWIKDGNELKPTGNFKQIEEPDGTISLQILKVTPKDAGKYALAIANDEGETRSSAPLTVNQPPVFTKPLLPVTVINGFPGKLEAKVSGVPRPTIEWLKNGQPFLTEGDHVKLYNPDGTVGILFEKCKPEHAGKYSCVAKNGYGDCTASGELEVIEKELDKELEAAPAFLSNLYDVSAKENETIKFEASVSGNPLPDVHWFLDEQPVLPSNNIHPMFDGKKVSLEIKKCNPQHAGNYECHLVNRVGNAISAAKAKVMGFTAPKFIQKLVDMEVPTTEPARLTCRVSGFPEPCIEWYRNGDLLYPGIKYSMSREGDQCHLNIPYPRGRDSGVFECQAKNVVGEEKCSAKIIISDTAEHGEAPIFLKRLIDIEALEGSSAKFTACITGIPKPLVKWFKSGEQLEPSKHYTMEHEHNGILRLIIYQLKPSDIGEYRVSVSNKYGSDTCTANLHLAGVDEYVPHAGATESEKQRKTGPPSPLPDPPFIMRMTDTYLTLGWRPSVPSVPRVPVTYEVEMCQEPDGKWNSYRSGLKDSVCDIRGLIPNQDYRFRIRVENKHGISDPSPYVSAYRSKLRPPTPADYKPKDYEIEHPPLDKHAAAPRFLRQEEEVMYGIRGQPVRIEFWVYGHPQPEISWLFNGVQMVEI
ncbi:muscle M-line assembly protein unc-89-like [Centruroides sculpturatus]|uniref:muscle M-line assembly protein unc-89-like n=1 Tax=Centruroides sculpturatus TaxID=218467 RepID=UPI000C6EFA30|nr:muscle M-line assembly protein unc-89-like [Centruroides sculpturatus]